MNPTVGSLFAGIGGFDLGFQRAGFEVKWQVEIDPWCRKVLAKNFPNAERYEDVKRVCGREETQDGEGSSRSRLESVDVIVGGFPCQDISYAGLGAGIEGERSGLWTEFSRIISELRPRFVLVENVTALLTRGLSRVLGDLAAVGYDAEWDCIPACSIGAPHTRDRVFILAYPNEELRGQRWGIKRSQIGNTERNLYLWDTESEPHRMANGVSNRVDRLGGLGNAVVPQIPELYARRIKEMLEGERA